MSIKGLQIGWREVELGDVLTFQRGFDITKKEQDPGPYAVISSSGPNSTHREYKVKGPGVVIGRKGTLGNVFFSEENFWPHDTTLWVKDFQGNDPKYAYYFLQTLQLQRFDVGASNPTLNRNHIHKLLITYPPLPIQRRIADILSAYDALIENNARRIAILEEMAQRTYREWFVHFRFPGHEAVRMVAGEDGVERPEGWGVAPVSEAVELNPRVKVAKDTENAFVPMQAVSETSMLIDLSRVERRTGNSGSKFQNGDTLFARITPCLENGKTAFMQFLSTPDESAIGSTEFIVMRSKHDAPEFVYLLARSEALRDHAIKSMSGASGRQRVQMSAFDDISIPIPDSATLQRFTTAVRPMFAQISALARKNAALRATRDLLLPKLVAGEIEVGALNRVEITR